MKILIAVTTVVIITILAIAGSYALGLHSLQQSQHQWCTTLDLLTATPVKAPSNPKANPSRENNYRFYFHLKELERDFRC